MTMPISINSKRAISNALFQFVVWGSLSAPPNSETRLSLFRAYLEFCDINEGIKEKPFPAGFEPLEGYLRKRLRTLKVYLSDSSLYRNPTGGSRYHFESHSRPGWSCCGASPVNKTNGIDSLDTPKVLRCQRSGCKRLWGGTSVDSD